MINAVYIIIKRVRTVFSLKRPCSCGLQITRPACRPPLEVHFDIAWAAEFPQIKGIAKFIGKSMPNRKTTCSMYFAIGDLIKIWMPLNQSAAVLYLYWKIIKYLHPSTYVNEMFITFPRKLGKKDLLDSIFH